MTLGNIASNAPAWSDLINQVGRYRRRQRAQRIATRGGWFGLGLLAGGGIAMLMTPRSGPEVREQIGEKAKQVRDYVTPTNASDRHSGEHVGASQ